MPKSKKPRKEYNPNKVKTMQHQLKPEQATTTPSLWQEIKREAALTATKWIVPCVIVGIALIITLLCGLDLHTAITILGMMK